MKKKVKNLCLSVLVAFWLIFLFNGWLGIGVGLYLGLGLGLIVLLSIFSNDEQSGNSDGKLSFVTDLLWRAIDFLLFLPFLYFSLWVTVGYDIVLAMLLGLTFFVRDEISKSLNQNSSF